MRFVDSRLLSSSSVSGGPVLCLGRDDKSGGIGRSGRECVTSVCFSGEYCIATAHARAYEVSGRKHRGVENTVQWWDRRMMREGEPTAVASVASFPMNDVCDASPVGCAQICGRRCKHYEDYCTDKCYCQSVLLFGTGKDAPHCDYPLEPDDSLTNTSCLKICHLTGSDNGSGHLAITMESNSVTETLIVDSLRQKIHWRSRMLTTPNRSDQASQIVPPSFSSQLDTMVCYGNRYCDGPGQNDHLQPQDSSILLFDASRHPSSSSILEQDTSRPLHTTSKKRPFKNLNDGT